MDNKEIKMQDRNYREYFNYYLELERDFFTTEPYVTIEKENFDTFSIQYNRIYQSICSEIDCLLKELCKRLECKSKAENISAYCKVIQSHFKYFNSETVYFYKSRIELEPWGNWSYSKAPTWWTMYNNVKHHRMETDKETNRQYYKFANLGNVINALAALYIVEEYYVYSYDFAKEIEITKTMQLNPNMIDEEVDKRMERALLGSKSRKCCMKQWQDAGCYRAFMGQDFFEVSNLKKLMNARELT